jgi:alpha-galactosidase/6-phospho-beta-glucosidase family protein
MSFKIAIIGAGSIGFTKKLVSDILCVPEFAEIEIALTDNNAHNLDMAPGFNQQFANENYGHHGSPSRFRWCQICYELRAHWRA